MAALPNQSPYSDPKKFQILDTTEHYHFVTRTKKRILALQGGARSGKTYNIMLALISTLFLSRSKVVISICRKTLPALKSSAFRDFLDIATKFPQFRWENLNKSEMIYRHGNSLMEFISIDKAQKRRGVGADIVFCNEANELLKDDFFQLIVRTRRRVIIDYNPSDEEHWIYDEVLSRDDCQLMVSTYRDNPFLDKNIVAEIERLQATDETYWQIYGLGQRAVRRSTIYPKWWYGDYENAVIRPDDLLGREPGPNKVLSEQGGIDFGFNHPTAVVTVKICDGAIFARQCLYEPGLTIDDLGNRIIEDRSLSKLAFFADNSRPEAIEALRRMGLDVRACAKGPGSVSAGIDLVKSNRLFVDPASPDLIKEIKVYKWKELPATGAILDEPVKILDDAMDALRYAVYGDGSGVLRLSSLRNIVPPRTHASQFRA